MTAPHYTDDTVTLYAGDCTEVMAGMADSSVDAVVTDPPYGLEFMGKEWDKFAPTTGNAAYTPNAISTAPVKSKFKDGVGTRIGAPKKNPRCKRCGKLGFDHSARKCQCETPDFDTCTAEYARTFQAWCETWAAECLRVLKPGGHMLAFGGTRTHHRLACAIEDAGFEIRDTITWLRASERQQTDILKAWREWSVCVPSAGIAFPDEVDSAPGPVLLRTNLANSPAAATIAELSFNEAHLIDAAHWRSVLSSAGAGSTVSSALVTIAESSPVSHGVTQSMAGSTAPFAAPAWLDGNIAARLKAAAALRIWLGSKPSIRQAATDALCAALTDDLRLITCAQSKTFRNYATTLQTVCVSATTVTTTAYTAANLIAFTVATLANQGGDATESLPGFLTWIYGSGFP